MANDAKHLALPLTHAVIVSLKKLNGYLTHSMFPCFFFLPCFAPFLHLMGSSRRLEAWFLGGLIVP
jgi:hypothetical protein